jgi:hypothetical protein
MAYPDLLLGNPGIRGRLRLLAYPRLHDLPPSQWDGALGRARETELDTLEWIGIVGALGFVTYALRPEAGAPVFPLILYLEQFLLALPMLTGLVGPLLLRRTRRGLDRELKRRNGGHA